MLANGDTSYSADTSGAAFYSNALASGVPAGCVTSKDDWFLGSIGEMKLMHDNLQGLGEFNAVRYWSSTEDTSSIAWNQSFGGGSQFADLPKTWTNRVRPVRAF